MDYMNHTHFYISKNGKLATSENVKEGHKEGYVEISVQEWLQHAVAKCKRAYNM